MLQGIEAHLLVAASVEKRVDRRVVVTELQKMRNNKNSFILRNFQLTIFFCNEFGVKTPLMIPLSLIA